LSRYAVEVKTVVLLRDVIGHGYHNGTETEVTAICNASRAKDEAPRYANRSFPFEIQYHWDCFCCHISNVHSVTHAMKLSSNSQLHHSSVKPAFWILHHSFSPHLPISDHPRLPPALTCSSPCPHTTLRHSSARHLFPPGNFHNLPHQR
jgi:hypothetical protein